MFNTRTVAVALGSFDRTQCIPASLTCFRREGSVRAQKEAEHDITYCTVPPGHCLLCFYLALHYIAVNPQMRIIFPRYYPVPQSIIIITLYYILLSQMATNQDKASSHGIVKGPSKLGLSK